MYIYKYIYVCICCWLVVCSVVACVGPCFVSCVIRFVPPSLLLGAQMRARPVGGAAIVVVSLFVSNGCRRVCRVIFGGCFRVCLLCRAFAYSASPAYTPARALSRALMYELLRAPACSVHAHAHAHAPTRTHTHTHTLTHTRTQTHMLTQNHAHAYPHTHNQTRTRTRANVDMHTRTHAQARTRTHMHTHSHTHALVSVDRRQWHKFHKCHEAII